MQENSERVFCSRRGYLEKEDSDERRMEVMVMVAMVVMVMAMVVTGMAVAMVDPTVVETEEE